MLEIGAAKQNEWRPQLKRLIFNKKLFSTQLGMTKWKPIYCDRYSFHSVFLLKSKLISTFNLDDRETTSSDIYPLTFRVGMNI